MSSKRLDDSRVRLRFIIWFLHKRLKWSMDKIFVEMDDGWTSPKVIVEQIAKVNLARDAHEWASLHRDDVAESEICGCFECLSLFGPHEIKQWIDLGRTALCPRCGVDTVIPDSCGFLSATLLELMNEIWMH